MTERVNVCRLPGTPGRFLQGSDAGVRKVRMGRQATVVLYLLAQVAVVVGVDLLFFRNRFWERLMVNVGIVLVFTAFYFRFLNRR
jgi:hypothetical protein